VIDEIRRAVGVLAPDRVVEVRALADGATHSGYFDDHERLIRAVEALDADPAVAGIYVTLNTVNPGLLARRANRIKMRLSRKDATTADADILRRRWLPVDIDPVRPSGVSSTDAEHAAALDAAGRIAAYLSEQGFGEPIRADSGNGAHLLYRIDLANDEAATEVVKGALATLDALFSNDVITVDTANYNAARIWKLYGTMSRKGDSTPERPHRRAKILAAPPEMEVVPLERLQHLAELLPKDEPAPRRKGGSIDLACWLAEHGIAVRSTRPWQGGTLYVLAECPFSGAHRDGAFAIQFANGAIFAGCHHASCGGGAQRWPELRAMYEKKSTPKKEENPTPPPAEDEYRKRALTILRDGDPLAFILDTFNKTHVGDRTVAESLAMSVASRSVENTNGLHVAISGNSGKGKTHACTTMQNLIPEDSRLKGTVSDRALYYDDDLRAGTVFLFDDVALSEDLQEILKSATTNFREPIEHRTLTTERKLRVCTIPARCVWWLAKVDDPGDDQVMNRMLTVWIDDSAEQDRRVLAHMKEVEATGRDQSEDDILTARAIWEAVGEEILTVRIPFARRIGFSTASNRRNPGMLFDLIKCHARLFYLQRDRDDDGAVVAREEDFWAAAKLYAALSGAAGGQETKLTRNEAAALETVAKMGVEVFTVRGLQSALGLSYHQTYRILHGYTNNRATYTGILDKCPAVSYIDATVAGEMVEVGETVRRREHYFSFDLEAYRAWSAQAAVWLDDDEPDGPRGSDGPGGSGGPDVCTFAPRLHQNSNESVNEDAARNDRDSSIGEISTEIGTDQSTHLHHLPGTESPRAGASSSSRGVCEIRAGANIPTIREKMRPIQEQPASGSFSRCKVRCKDVQTGVNVQTSAPVNPRDYIALPVAKDEPCHVCGRRPTSSVKRGGGGKYLCYDCLRKAKRPTKVQPLPGVLDHRTFERVRTEIGRCDVCGAGKAVYRSREAQVGICEGCYARLVREWNRGEGVR
jgi:energy-coupling factor transporter ATP-binding protein EcfA2